MRERPIENMSEAIRKLNYCWKQIGISIAFIFIIYKCCESNAHMRLMYICDLWSDNNITQSLHWTLVESSVTNTNIHILFLNVSCMLSVDLFTWNIKNVFVCCYWFYYDFFVPGYSVFFFLYVSVCNWFCSFLIFTNNVVQFHFVNK